jgi:hypothetical protein
MEMELFLYDSPAFNNFLKGNTYEAGSEVWLITELIRESGTREEPLWKFLNGKQRLKKKER